MITNYNKKKITTIHYRKNEMKNKTNLKTKIKKKKSEV